MKIVDKLLKESVQGLKKMFEFNERDMSDGFRLGYQAAIDQLKTEEFQEELNMYSGNDKDDFIYRYNHYGMEFVTLKDIAEALDREVEDEGKKF